MPLNPETIIAEVAIITGVPAPAITGKRRSRRVCYARFLAIHAIRAAHDWWPLVDIAAAINRRDHCCIIYSLRQHAVLMKTTPEYRQWEAELTDTLAAL